MNKNILIDFTQIPVLKAGVGVYAINLLDNIFRTDIYNNYFVIVQSDESLSFFDRKKNVKLIVVAHKIFRKFFFRGVLEQFYLPLLILRYKINIIHSLHFTFPILTFHAKKVVTIHDLTFFSYPKLHQFIKRFYFRLFIKLSANFCDSIICVSESTKKDLISRFPKAQKVTTVIPLGKDERFKPDLDKMEIAKCCKKYDIIDKYILFVGTLEPRKNLIMLINAYSRFRKFNHDYKLVIAGKKGWFYNKIFEPVINLRLQNDVIFTGFVDECDKPFLISGAKIFVYPSFYEGFGIPVLEALSCGIPTITSNISSMPEVAGDAAILINPNNELELVNALSHLLSDNSLYYSLKQKSILRAKEFSWLKTAEKTIELYKSIN